MSLQLILFCKYKYNAYQLVVLPHLSQVENLHLDELHWILYTLQHMFGWCCPLLLFALGKRVRRKIIPDSSTF